MKANQRFPFAQKLQRGSFEWNAQAVDGKKSVRCVGNGSVKNSKKKSVRENKDAQEVNNPLHYNNLY